jgi:uncharacterized membrane protein YfcA
LAQSLPASAANIGIALGSIAGGWLGSSYGRRLPAAVLRGVIVVVGVTAIAQLLT